MKRLLPIALLLLFSVKANAVRMDFNCEDHMDDDLAALACNLYWEGRNQSPMGMMAIAAVTLWRVQDPEFPDTVAGVVWEKRWSKRYGRYYPQFQWTLDGKSDLPFANEQEAWDMAWNIARIFAVDAAHKARICPQVVYTQRMWDYLEEQGTPVTRRPLRCEAYEILMRSKFSILAELDPTKGSVMYHADYVKPAWRTSYVMATKVDTHIFYHK